ncbi:type II toxin-antitoxin system ParD family antitoxin [Rheinheimera muenzenbergensis]|uniref:Antitoxin ParD n=1 Tax=Rheinheimera muenzenbergensis TaxID=1193628 RepID=A0ABU8CC33_9GAMM
MARTTSVNIDPHLDALVSQLLESCRYGSTSEVMRSALHLLEHQENQMAVLRQAVAAGEQSGESDLTLSQIADLLKQQHHV